MVCKWASRNLKISEHKTNTKLAIFAGKFPGRSDLVDEAMISKPVITYWYSGTIIIPLSHAGGKNHVKIPREVGYDP